MQAAPTATASMRKCTSIARFCKPFPDFLRRIKSAGEVSRDETGNEHVEPDRRKEKSGQPENAAQNRGERAAFSIRRYVRRSSFEKFDSRGTTLGNGMSRQRQNFGAVGQVTRAMVVVVAVVLDRDSFAFGFGQRRVADGAIALAAQQRAGMVGIGVLGGLKLCR